MANINFIKMPSNEYRVSGAACHLMVLQQSYVVEFHFLTREVK